MKRLLLNLLLVIVASGSVLGQEYFTITSYKINVRVNKDASLDIDELISVHFRENRHGIYRVIPYKYPLLTLSEGSEKAERQLVSNGYTHTIIENIKVDGWEYEVNNDGDDKSIKIGSADKVVDGDQKYAIHYRILNAINFFKDHSELYFNLVGNRWATTIDSVNFTVELYDALSDTPENFVATGPYGSEENNTISQWTNNKTFSGITTRQLSNNEGVTVGIRFPKDFVIKPDYRFRGVAWLLLPLLLFPIVYTIWKRKGKDEPVIVKAEYYPPPNLSPSISGYIIDDKLNQRDLTALVPYWGAGGYLRVKETESKSLLGLIKIKEYEFTKLKELPAEAMDFEKTLFNGIFRTGEVVMLNQLKNVLYKSMATAKKELEAEIQKSEYYVKGSRGLGSLFIVVSIVFAILGFISIQNGFYAIPWKSIALFLTAIFVFWFGLIMIKRTKKGTELYQYIAGFKEFIRSVENDRLAEFLKQDEHYFDKILPYAIVFNVADNWKDKLAGLEVPPPTWYAGSYHTFNTGNFMSSLNRSMNTMSSTFYSSPRSSGTSGGSFSGGGGFSGGGFGGGGGSSW